MRSNYTKLQPREKVIGYNDFALYILNNKIISSGDNTVGKSFLNSLLFFKLLVDAKSLIDLEIKNNSKLKEFYYELDNSVGNTIQYKLKKNVLGLLGYEFDENTDFLDLFGDYYFEDKGMVELPSAKIKVVTDKNSYNSNNKILDELLEQETQGLHLVCLPGGEIYTQYTNKAPLINMLFVKRSGASRNISRDIPQQHYTAFTSTVLDPHSYDTDEEKQILQSISNYFSLDQQQVLIQLYLLSEIEAHAGYKNPIKTSDYRDKSKTSHDSLFSILFEGHEAEDELTKQFSESIMDSIKKVGCDDYKKIQALLHLGLPIDVIQENFGKIDTADIVTKNILQNYETFSNSHKVVMFLLNQLYSGDLNKVFSIIKLNYLDNPESLKDVFIRTLPYLLAQKFDEDEIFEAIENSDYGISYIDFLSFVDEKKSEIFVEHSSKKYNLGSFYPMNLINGFQQTTETPTNNLELLTQEYELFEKELFEETKSSGKYSEKYLGNTINFNMILFLEKHAKHLFSEIKSMRQRYDPNIFFLITNVDLNDRDVVINCKKLSQIYPAFVKRFAWEPKMFQHSKSHIPNMKNRELLKYFLFWDHSDILERLTTKNKTPIPHYVAVLPKLQRLLKERSEKQESFGVLFEESKEKIQIYEKEKGKLDNLLEKVDEGDKSFVESMVQFFMNSEKLNREQAIKKARSCVNKARKKVEKITFKLSDLYQEIEKKDNELSNLDNLVDELYNNHHEIINDFEKGFNQLPFIQNLNIILLPICQYLHNLRHQYKKQIPKFSYAQFLKDFIINYPGKGRIEHLRAISQQQQIQHKINNNHQKVGVKA
tara:strand:- start:38 stop:2509 length:2472 start_codon:yes stop_codon:yes gene_type:complete